MEMNFRVNSTRERSAVEGHEWTTTSPLTPEEEDAVVTLVIIVLGVIIAIVVLFSMGIFLDCKHQIRDSRKKKTRLRMKMPLSPLKKHKDDGRSLASDMCPSGTTQFGAIKMTEDAAV
ncbi:uncharacterized protein LOC107044394 [Diachasma alloeum]|uniref:uncharacterized protein LOC107044394 n=1 Tax=Diachasma alloeum TaxID=454923 RepID=UPI0007380FF6|nr:uncharacterized protein LOC107044394 [Diachasma alloeum]